MGLQRLNDGLGRTVAALGEAMELLLIRHVQNSLLLHVVYAHTFRWQFALSIPLSILGRCSQIMLLDDGGTFVHQFVYLLALSSSRACHKSTAVTFLLFLMSQWVGSFLVPG